MLSFIIRRLLLAVVTLLLVTIIIFVTVRLIPGSALDMMASNFLQYGATAAGGGVGGAYMKQRYGETATTETELTVAYLKQRLGLDVPIYVQYGRWLRGVFQWDLGESLWTDRKVTEDLAQRIPISFELGIIAILTGLSIALPIGTYSAIRQDTYGDYIGRSIAIIAISIPGFWLGTMVIIYPSIWWGWSPSMVYIPFMQDPLANLIQFALPGIILGMLLSGVTMRMTRTMMLEVLRQDYIRTAWSKGLTERAVVLRHALKNALIPVVTMVGMQIPLVISGAVILEQIFALPGIGILMIKALNSRDYPVISGINLLVASVTLVCNLAVDIAYGWLDPRVRYE